MSRQMQPAREPGGRRVKSRDNKRAVRPVQSRNKPVMQISQQRYGDVRVITSSGRIDNATSETFRAGLGPHVAGPSHKPGLSMPEGPAVFAA